MAAEEREALRSVFDEDVQCLRRELQCLKRAMLMYTVGLRALAGRLKAVDAARRETIRELGDGDASMQEAIRGPEASLRAGGEGAAALRSRADGAERDAMGSHARLVFAELTKDVAAREM